MDFLKELFGEEPMTWEQFSEAVSTKGYKLADLSTGNYVSKAKYTDELKQKDATITDLSGQIATRDTDLESLRTQLTNAGTDNKTKVTELTNSLTKLQGDYDSIKTNYENRLTKQAYEFAVKEFAGTKKFSSNAAKRDFINEMLAKDLKLENNTILGAEDFVKVYSETNADAFVVDKPEPDPKPNPNFINPVAPTPAPNENAFMNAFNFTGVRPHEK